METATQILSRLKELTGRLTPRRGYLSARTGNLGKRSARFGEAEWRELVPGAKSLRREFAALLKTLD
jgi:hypothetical protein